MYRYFITIFAAILFSVSAWAGGINKQTHLYAVKGADSLYLDHYVSPIEGKRPCMMFVFGGGFAAGHRDNKLYTQYFEFLTKQGFDVVSID
jgi:carboxylesterase type B